MRMILQTFCFETDVTHVQTLAHSNVLKFLKTNRIPKNKMKLCKMLLLLLFYNIRCIGREKFFECSDGWDENKNWVKCYWMCGRRKWNRGTVCCETDIACANISMKVCQQRNLLMKMKWSRLESIAISQNENAEKMR